MEDVPKSLLIDNLEIGNKNDDIASYIDSQSNNEVIINREKKMGREELIMKASLS